MTELDSPLPDVVGGRAAQALEKAFDLRTVRDLLLHYPRRYDERGQLTDLASVAVGEQVTVLAEVRKVNARPMRNRRGKLVEVIVGDGRRTLSLTFFNQPWRERQLVVGATGLFAGKVTEFRGTRQLTNPDCELLDSPDPDSAGAAVSDFVGAIIPVYPATAKLKSWDIARCVRVALDVLDPPPDPIPAELRERLGLVDLATALRDIHRPADHEAMIAARYRRKWDEALALQVGLALRRLGAVARAAVARPPRADGLLAEFDAGLPFVLTAGQREVGDLLAEELAAEHPMHRLLQGEVGSGKTVVALRAMLQVVDSGGQAALLAPTEVLAAQHARSLRQLLGPLALAGQLGGADHATEVTLLTASLSAAARRAALLDAASGQAGIVVGTHALLEEKVQFADLGLVVVDEQHRFGVEQRDVLRAKAGGDTRPHTLVMTATPIPRTVAMTVFGDLDTSALTELPAGRSPISTTLVPAAERPTWLARAWERVREEVSAGHQAYVVCPRIGGDAADDDTDEPDDAELDGELDEPPDDGPGSGSAAGPAARRPPVAVLDVAPELAEGALAGLRVGILHGRLPADEKDTVMRRFADGELDVLIATTVIEVGVDVPNATAMVILDADRFGISALHQLRGRVGRGSAASLCLLVTDAPTASPAYERLAAVEATGDGFELARVDLERRREGDVLGAAQSGRRSRLRLLSILRDEDLIVRARDEAIALVEADPELDRHPALAAEVATLVEDDRAAYLEKG